MSTTFIPFMRPLTLGEVLDQAIRLYRRNFLTFVGIIAIPYIPLTLIQTGLTYLSTSSATSILDNPSPTFSLPSGYFVGLIGIILVGLLQFLLVNGVAAAALTRAVADNYTGQPVDILGSFGKIGSLWMRLLGVLLLFILIIIVGIIWAVFIPCVGWLTGPGLLVFLGIVVIPLTAPVVVLERHDVLASMRRAWDLSRSRFWWLLGFAFVLSLLAQLIITGPTYIINLIMQYFLLNQGDYVTYLTWQSVIQTFVQMLGGLLYLPLQLTAMTVVYLDLRVRSEGLDLAMQAAANAGTEANIISVAETSPQPTGNLITGTEVGQFILLTLAFLAIYAILVGIILAITMAFMSAMSF